MKFPVGLCTSLFFLGILFVDSISDYSPDIQYFKDHNDTVLKSGFPFNSIIPLLLLINFIYFVYHSVKGNKYHLFSLFLLIGFGMDFALSSIPKLLAIQSTTDKLELVSIQQGFRFHHGMMILMLLCMALIQILEMNKNEKPKKLKS